MAAVALTEDSHLSSASPSSSQIGLVKKRNKEKMAGKEKKSRRNTIMGIQFPMFRRKQSLPSASSEDSELSTQSLSTPPLEDDDDVMVAEEGVPRMIRSASGPSALPLADLSSLSVYSSNTRKKSKKKQLLDLLRNGRPSQLDLVRESSPSGSPRTSRHASPILGRTALEPNYTSRRRHSLLDSNANDVFEAAGSEVSRGEYGQLPSSFSADGLELMNSAGTGVQLTLLRRPPDSSGGSGDIPSHTVGGTNLSNRNITEPIPPTPEQEEKFFQSRLSLTKRMLQEAEAEEQRLRQEYKRNPSVKAGDKLAEKESTVLQIEKQFHELTKGSNNGSAGGSRAIDCTDQGGSSNVGQIADDLGLQGQTLPPRRPIAAPRSSPLLPCTPFNPPTSSPYSSWDPAYRLSVGPNLGLSSANQIGSARRLLSSATPSKPSGGSNAVLKRTHSAGANVPIVSARHRLERIGAYKSPQSPQVTDSMSSSASSSGSAQPGGHNRGSPTMGSRLPTPTAKGPSPQREESTSGADAARRKSAASPLASSSLSVVDSSPDTNALGLSPMENSAGSIGDSTGELSSASFRGGVADLTLPIPASSPMNNIIGMDESEFEEDEPPKEHTPFTALAKLRGRHAHTAVFLSYLISNSDPTQMLFFVVAEMYSGGSFRELKKWSYEIFSTFLLPSGPLSMKLSVAVIHSMESVLRASERDERQLKRLFEPALRHISLDLEESLADFRSKLKLGFGGFFGDQDLKESMDKKLEADLVEKTLRAHYDKFKVGTTSRCEAVTLTLATILREWTKGAGLDKMPSFVMKDRRLKDQYIKRLAKKKESLKKHNFHSTVYHCTATCDVCKAVLWGVGFQGFQCQICDLKAHKECLLKVDVCSKVGSKPKSVRKPSGFGFTKTTAGASRSDSNSMLPDGGGTPGLTQTVESSPSTSKGQGQGGTEETTEAGTPSVLEMVGKFEGGQAVQSTGEGQISASPSPDLGSEKQREGRGSERIREAFLAGPPAPPHGSGSSVSRSESFGKILGIKKSGSGSSGNSSGKRFKSDTDKDDVVSALKRGGSASTTATSSSSNQSLRSTTSSVDPAAITPGGTTYGSDSDLDVEPEMPPLDDIIGKNVVKKLKPKEKKQQETINELFYTERTHVRNLKLIDRLFRRPMAAAHTPEKLLNLLFPNLDELLQIHIPFNNAMKTKLKNTRNAKLRNISSLLLERFSGSAGEEMKRVCAAFCADHKFALEQLKERRRKDPKLNELLNNAERDPDCRRLRLADVIISEVQRLTKYPLLIQGIVKATPTTEADEISNLNEAVGCCKAVLGYVNKAVEEKENVHRMAELQKRLDRRPVENSVNPMLQSYKDLDLRNHTLLYEGPLTWRLAKGLKNVELHALLLEDILVLLQKQEDGKLVLRCQSTVVSPNVQDAMFNHSPIVRMNTVIVRTVAYDKKAFFLISTSDLGPQIYDLIAHTVDEKKRWFNAITKVVDSCKKQTISRTKRMSTMRIKEKGGSSGPNGASPTPDEGTEAADAVAASEGDVRRTTSTVTEEAEEELEVMTQIESLECAPGERRSATAAPGIASNIASHLAAAPTNEPPNAVFAAALEDVESIQAATAGTEQRDQIDSACVSLRGKLDHLLRIMEGREREAQEMGRRLHLAESLLSCGDPGNRDSMMSQSSAAPSESGDEQGTASAIPTPLYTTDESKRLTYTIEGVQLESSSTDGMDSSNAPLTDQIHHTDTLTQSPRQRRMCQRVTVVTEEDQRVAMGTGEDCSASESEREEEDCDSDSVSGGGLDSDTGTVRASFSQMGSPDGKSDGSTTTAGGRSSVEDTGEGLDSEKEAGEDGAKWEEEDFEAMLEGEYDDVTLKPQKKDKKSVTSVNVSAIDGEVESVVNTTGSSADPSVEAQDRNHTHTESSDDDDACCGTINDLGSSSAQRESDTGEKAVQIDGRDGNVTPSSEEDNQNVEASDGEEDVSSCGIMGENELGGLNSSNNNNNESDEENSDENNETNEEEEEGVSLDNEHGKVQNVELDGEDDIACIGSSFHGVCDIRKRDNEDSDCESDEDNVLVRRSGSVTVDDAGVDDSERNEAGLEHPERIEVGVEDAERIEVGVEDPESVEDPENVEYPERVGAGVEDSERIEVGVEDTERIGADVEDAEEIADEPLSPVSTEHIHVEVVGSDEDDDEEETTKDDDADIGGDGNKDIVDAGLGNQGDGTGHEEQVGDVTSSDSSPREGEEEVGATAGECKVDEACTESDENKPNKAHTKAGETAIKPEEIPAQSDGAPHVLNESSDGAKRLDSDEESSGEKEFPTRRSNSGRKKSIPEGKRYECHR